jgi:hypothetical protein
MKDFDQQWQSCAAQARRAPPRDERAPWGFSTRVLAEAWSAAPMAVSLEQVWQRLTWRSLGMVAVLLIVCAALELPHLRDRKPLEPGIENTVAQLVWGL